MTTIEPFVPSRSDLLHESISNLATVARDKSTTPRDREALARAAKAIAVVIARVTREEIQGDMFAPEKESEA